ncbi:MAG: DUF4249 family protein [Calditrichaeota bacterium]|nr:DUF4249 family protein [Calditrichota bacterium]
MRRIWTDRRIILLILIGLAAGIGGSQCSKNPQLPSIHYNPELVVFGILSPGSYQFKGGIIENSLSRNFFVVQRTYQMDEKLVFQKLPSVDIFIDSVKLFPVGYAKRESYDPNGPFSTRIDSVRVYSFDQKKFPIHEGQTYTLRVNVPGFTSLRAITRVPDAPVIYSPKDTVYLSEKQFVVKWTPVEPVGGYRFSVLVKDMWSAEEWPVIEDEVSRNTHHYVVDLKRIWPYEGLRKISIEVQALDENYADYISLRNLIFSNCLTKENFNVEGGYGLFGSMASDKKTIILEEK